MKNEKYEKYKIQNENTQLKMFSLSYRRSKDNQKVRIFLLCTLGGLKTGCLDNLSQYLVVNK